MIESQNSFQKPERPYAWMISEEMEEYLRKEFMYNTLPKYHKYFDEWLNSLLPTQILYYIAYWMGNKTPFETK